MITEKQNSQQKFDCDQESAKFFYSGTTPVIHRTCLHATSVPSMYEGSKLSQAGRQPVLYIHLNYKVGLQVNKRVPEPGRL